MRHDYPTDDREHPVTAVGARAAHIAALAPGDVIACGTTHQGLGPLQDGERIARESDTLGRMAVGVHDPLQRRWPTGVDEVMVRAVRERRAAPPA